MRQIRLAKSKNVVGCWLAAIFLLNSSITIGGAYAASQLKPVLKKIDPTTAKVDEPAEAPPPPSPPPAAPPTLPNFGRQPVTQPTQQPYYGQQPMYGQPPGYPPQTPYGQPYAPQYAPQPPYGGYAPPYNPQYNMPPMQSGYGYPQQSPQQYAMPPQQQYQPVQQPYAQQPNYGGYPYPQQPQYYAQPQPPSQPGNRLESLIPDFGKPLPQVPPNMQGQMPPGPGFAAGYAPPAQAMQAAEQEQRLARLEQSAFGSTYPEHEIDDRIEHLEREVFGQPGSGDANSRIEKLEAKVGVQGAFGRPASSQATPPRMEKPRAIGSPNGNAPVKTAALPPGWTPQAVPPYATRSPRPDATPPAVEAPIPPITPEVPADPVPSIEPNQSNGAPESTTERSTQSPADEPELVAAAQSLPVVTPAAGNADTGFTSVVKGIPYEQKAGDYFSNVQRFGTGYAHWAKFPIKVHLPMNTSAPWQAALEAAITKWNQYIPIAIASPDDQADIEVSWINHLAPKQLGITNLEIFNGRMRVTVYLLRPSYYPPDVQEKLLPQIAMHEIGHGLGIFAHSPNPGDIMQSLDVLSSKGKASSKLGNISQRDVNTLKRIYEAPALPPGFQSPQPIGWALQHYDPQLRK